MLLNIAQNGNLCIGNFCLKEEQLKNIDGHLNAPVFLKKIDGKNKYEEMYYNHDSNTSVDELPEKMCIKNTNPDSDSSETTSSSLEKQNKTKYKCLDSVDFEILNGERGIKLSPGGGMSEKTRENLDSIKVETTTQASGTSQVQDNDESYIMPYYIDFREQGYGLGNVKDNLFFKENYNCANNNTLLDKFPKVNKKFNERRYPYIKGFDYGEKCYLINDRNANTYCNQKYGRLCQHTCCEKLAEKINNSSTKSKLKIPDWCPSNVLVDEARTNTSNSDEVNENKLNPVKNSVDPINTIEHPIDHWGTGKKGRKKKERHYERLKSDPYNLSAGAIELIKNMPKEAGYFEVPSSFIDKDYQGYYLNEANKNVKYNYKENLLGDMSRYLGSDMSHRASHNGVCNDIGESVKANYICSGKNRYNPDFESVCNRVNSFRKAKFEEIMGQDSVTEPATDAVGEVIEDPRFGVDVWVSRKKDERWDNINLFNWKDPEKRLSEPLKYCPRNYNTDPQQVRTGPDLIEHKCQLKEDGVVIEDDDKKGYRNVYSIAIGTDERLVEPENQTGLGKLVLGGLNSTNEEKWNDLVAVFLSDKKKNRDFTIKYWKSDEDYDNRNKVTTAATEAQEITEEFPMDYNNEMRIDNLNNLDELNYVITPARDKNGNIIKTNTYFHAHEHIHD